MDTVLLFALPLVGGLIFCSNWNYTRWQVVRQDGHRLYFTAVFWGAILFVAVAIVRALLRAKFPAYEAIDSSAAEFIKPMAKDPVAAAAVADIAITSFLTMIVGWPLAKILNWIFWKNFWLKQAIIKADDINVFLLEAAENEDPICATMDDGKVYVGYVVKGYGPKEGAKHIHVLPLMSGYRDPTTHKVTFTTFYDQLYGDDAVADKKPLPGPLAHLYAEDFITAIAADHVLSWRLFDATAYLEFQKLKGQGNTDASESKPPSEATQPARAHHWEAMGISGLAGVVLGLLLRRR